MHTFEIVTGLGIAFLVFFQLWLTWRVWRSGLYERKQKVMQMQLIWLLPVAGAVLVFSVLRDDERAEHGTETTRHLQS